MSNASSFTVKIDLGIALARQVTDEKYRKSKITMQLHEKITLRKLVNQLGIPEKYISFIAVDGDMCSWDATVEQNAEIILFPYITGG